MKVLVACECSGRVREAFRTRGADAWSVDLKPSEDGSPYHCTEDVFVAIASDRWDLLIAHPPCTYLCGSGMHWTTRGIRPQHLTDDAVWFALRLWRAPVPRICIENPVGILARFIGPATQYVQPYQFGHDASKKTGLWLRGLPMLKLDPRKYIQPRLVCACGTVWKFDPMDMRQPGCPSCGETSACSKPRWGNQTDSGQNRLGPSSARATERARTYEGIAEAMADAWMK